MRIRFGILVMVLGLAVTVVGCGSAPTADIDAATTAITAAGTAGAADYAAPSLKEAEDAKAALDAELKAQEGKWFKSYDKAKELAVAAKAAGEKAASDAAAGKEKAKADATQGIADAKAALTEAQGLLDKAPKGKGSAADIAAMKTDLTTAATTITEAEAALGNMNYLDAKAKAESARNAATTVKTAVEEAMAAKKK
jgi:hypothetical protein